MSSAVGVYDSILSKNRMFLDSESSGFFTRKRYLYTLFPYTFFANSSSKPEPKSFSLLTSTVFVNEVNAYKSTDNAVSSFAYTNEGLSVAGSKFVKASAKFPTTALDLSLFPANGSSGSPL